MLPASHALLRKNACTPMSMHHLGLCCCSLRPACLHACLCTSLLVNTVQDTAHAVVYTDAGVHDERPLPPWASLSRQQDQEDGIALASWHPPHGPHMTSSSVASSSSSSLRGASGRAAPMQASSEAAAPSGGPAVNTVHLTGAGREGVRIALQYTSHSPLTCMLILACRCSSGCRSGALCRPAA